jgi:hypothetical protein
MAMIASDIATIPTTGFNWYVLFLEDRYDDPIKIELSSNFLALGQEVGRNALVVRGFDEDTFYSSVYEAVTLYDDEWHQKMTRPALLISDTAPRLLLEEPNKLKAAKLILIPLSQLRSKGPGAIVDLLRNLVLALRDEDAVRLLVQLDSDGIKRKWGWLTKYLDLKPSFMGFGINLNAVLEDLLSARDRA